jgi:hypothetical protein
MLLERISEGTRLVNEQGESIVVERVTGEYPQITTVMIQTGEEIEIVADDEKLYVYLPNQVEWEIMLIEIPDGEKTDGTA